MEIHWWELPQGSLGQSCSNAFSLFTWKFIKKMKVIASWRPHEATLDAAAFRMSVGDVSESTGHLVALAESLRRCGRSDSVGNAMLLGSSSILPPCRLRSMCHENMLVDRCAQWHAAIILLCDKQHQILLIRCSQPHIGIRVVQCHVCCQGPALRTAAPAQPRRLTGSGRYCPEKLPRPTTGCYRGRR